MGAGNHLNDQHAWSQGTARISSLLAALPEELQPRLAATLADYRRTKERLAAVLSEYDPASECRDCKGQCCLNGKYRMSVFDAMALLVENFQLSVNFAQKPLCPYGAEHGCLMEPGDRPADCILFICDALDLLLSPEARQLLSELELELRRCISSASTLTNEPLGKPLLLWAKT